MGELPSGSKDFFSGISDTYAIFRPDYPPALVRYISRSLRYRGVAWDCACGNGQLAKELIRHFHFVIASDISENQISKAAANKGILYTVQPAEQTDFPDEYFDLIMIGQALHWFDFDSFYKEADRVLAPKGLIVALGYGLLDVNDEVDKVICRLYKEILGDYWPPERKYIENRYADIPWPFEPLEIPPFEMKFLWTREQLEGYLNTWSAGKEFEIKNRFNPLSLILGELKEAWGSSKQREVRFPLFIKAGKKNR